MRAGALRSGDPMTVGRGTGDGKWEDRRWGEAGHPELEFVHLEQLYIDREGKGKEELPQKMRGRDKPSDTCVTHRDGMRGAILYTYMFIFLFSTPIF